MKHLDKVILLTALIGGGLTTYLIFRKTTNEQATEVVALAKVGEMMGEARVRREGIIGWHNLQEEENLYSRDSIISLDETFLRLDLQGGNSLNMTPNTLVNLVLDDDATLIDLQRGVLDLSLVNLKNRLLINVGKKQIEVKSNGAKMHVSLGDAHDTHFTVVDGAVSITYQKNQINLKKGEKVIINESTTKLDLITLGIEVLMPGLEKTIFQEKGKPIDFEWNSRDKTIEVFGLTAARDPRMKSIVGEMTTKEKYATLDLEQEGRYYWQVVGLVQNKVVAEAPVYSFVVRKKSAPALVYPGNNTVIELGPNEKSTKVTLRWESQSAEKYEVEFFKYEIEKEQGEILSTDHPYIAIDNLEPREYKWRVRAINPLRAENEWSAFRSFIVAEINSGPKRRSEFYEEYSGEWKRKVP